MLLQTPLRNFSSYQLYSRRLPLPSRICYHSAPEESSQSDSSCSLLYLSSPQAPTLRPQQNHRRSHRPPRGSSFRSTSILVPPGTRWSNRRARTVGFHSSLSLTPLA